MARLLFKVSVMLIVLVVGLPYIMLGPAGLQPLVGSLEALSPSNWFESAPSLPTFKSGDSVANISGGTQLIQWSRDQQAGPEILSRQQLQEMQQMSTISAQDNIYYRWQDANGVWQFSATPNLNTDNRVIRTDPNANVLSGLSEDQVDIALGRPLRSAAATAANGLAGGTTDSPSDSPLEMPNLPLPATIPVAEIPKLIEQAKNVQSLVDQRHLQQQSYF